MSSRFISRGAEQYDGYMGRWSRRLAGPFLDFAGLAAGERVLEVGCGTGSLTFTLPARAEIASVEAIDYEAKFVEAARARNSNSKINIRQGDACNLQFPDRVFDRALSMLVLHFVTDPERAIAEMRRVVRPGGVAAAAVWDNFGGMPSNRMFWDTMAAIEPRAIERRAPALIRRMATEGEMRDAFSQAGFVNVVETMLTIRMDFANFDDYWIPTITGQGSHAEFMATLTDSMRQRIEDAVKAAYLCNRPDGPRSFSSVAWAVRGAVPPV